MKIQAKQKEHDKDDLQIIAKVASGTLNGD
jgi:hypothetical protein